VAKRGFFGRIADAYRAASLDWEVKHGLRPWGRQNVEMEARATLTAVVIRADGTREDLGVLSEETVILSSDQVEALRRASGSK
jgi:hypothetical protein